MGCELVLVFSNTPRLNAGYRTPYCVANVTAPTVIARDPSTPDQVLANANTGDRLMVVSRTASSSGDWYRIMLHGGDLGWVNATSTTLSAGCGIFLAQAPGLSGELLQCTATVITGGITAAPAPENAEIHLFRANGERFAALEAGQNQFRALAARRHVRLDRECVDQRRSGQPVAGLRLRPARKRATRAKQEACLITPVNLFVNVRTHPGIGWDVCGRGRAVVQRNSGHRPHGRQQLVSGRWGLGGRLPRHHDRELRGSAP